MKQFQYQNEIDLLNFIYLQTPYAETAPNATIANVVPTNNGAVSSRYVPIEYVNQ